MLTEIQPSGAADTPKMEGLYRDRARTVRPTSKWDEAKSPQQQQPGSPPQVPLVETDGVANRGVTSAWPEKTDDDSAGLAFQLANAVGNVRMPTINPDARYLFYDILEHEQLNKQRKGFMYALKIAQSLRRELVLHRLRVRKYGGGGSQQQGKAPSFTHTFFPWRKFFNMSRLTDGLPRVHEFDVLLHALGGGFAFDHVLYMNSLLEGRRDMIGVHDRQVLNFQLISFRCMQHPLLPTVT